MHKEQIVFQKQQLKSRCLNTTVLNFFGEYAESDEQIKTRIHSHLLTGRLNNKALIAFAYEIIKKDMARLMDKSGDKNDFRVPQKIFKKAAKKVIEIISTVPKSILKKRLADMDLSTADLSLRR